MEYNAISFTIILGPRPSGSSAPVCSRERPGLSRRPPALLEERCFGYIPGGQGIYGKQWLPSQSAEETCFEGCLLHHW